MRLCCTVINIRPQCMKRNTALTIGFFSGNFSAAQTAAYHNFYTLCTHTHRTAYAGLHRPAKCNTAFQLSGNILCYQRSIHIRLLDFSNININMLRRKALQALFDLFNTGAAAANDHARLCRMNNQFQTVFRTFRFDLGDTSHLQSALQIFTDLYVFMQIHCKIFVSIPLCIPSFYDAKAHAMWINFLTQCVSLLFIFLLQRQ